jgi:pimeloyl-ACP methyl ester carboxylesterase
MPLEQPEIEGVTHRVITVGDLAVHVAEAGSGPLVMLLHGFPESWYSWRHQLTALAAAGYHAVAPDQRGYGAAGGPKDAAQYTMLHLAGDVIGLMDALGEDRAAVAGHDWGAPVAWNTALLRPDRVSGVIGLSVPYTPRGSTPPVPALRSLFGDGFYISYFQQPGVADAELSRDPRATFRRVLSSASGDAVHSRGDDPPRPPAVHPRADDPPGPPAVGGGVPVVPAGGGFLDICPEPAMLPGWLTDRDIDVFAAQFAESGFTGPLNWYRAMDLSWELMAAWKHAPVTVPAAYLAGDRDVAVSFLGGSAVIDQLRAVVPGLRLARLMPGCGHWTQQERADEVSAAMVSFLRGLG